jgi:NitT/TauT family transport system substrate-binding protein
MMTMGKRKRIKCSLGAKGVADWQKEERSSPHDICRQRWTVFGAMNYTPNMRQNKATFFRAAFGNRFRLSQTALGSAALVRRIRIGHRAGLCATIPVMLATRCPAGSRLTRKSQPMVQRTTGTFGCAAAEEPMIVSTSSATGAGIVRGTRLPSQCRDYAGRTHERRRLVMTNWTKCAVGALTAAALFFAAGQASAVDKVTFATNWKAEAEHGGFYQAVADGTYAKYGLEVTIRPGGPQSNERALLTAGKVEFLMDGNLDPAFNAVKEDIPTRVIAAVMQRDPQVFMTHPSQGLDTWESLKKTTMLVSRAGVASFYQWMIAEHGFSESQIKPYTFNPAPFIADKRSAQQGYVTAEPYAVEKQGGFKPNIFLLADHGYDTYATTIETTIEMIEKKPDVVQRFVDASIIGWYNYLYGDNKAANALIKKDNPDMDDAQIAFSIQKMKEYGIVDSGDTLKLGIGAMTDERVKSFFNRMVKAKLLKADLDYKKAYTLQFVNKGVGLNLKKP